MQADLLAGVQSYTLENGARAVFKRKSNVPLVTMAIALRAGVFAENTERAGLTGLMARTSIKGTRARSAAQIAEAAENMGGSVSPSVAADAFDWEITVPSKHFERALDLLSDVAFNAAFPEPEFAVEKKLTLSDLQQTRDDMYRYPLRLCLQQAFRDHPYGNSITDVERVVSNADAPGVAAWHAEQLQAGPWLFVVGDVDPDAAARTAGALLPHVRVQHGQATPRSEWHGAGTIAETREKAQTAMALAFPGPDRNNTDTHTLHVLANAVGGLGGRFFEELRSKRSLAYTVSLLPIARWLGGAFVAYIATSPEREAEARTTLLEQFTRLKDELLSQEEVSRAQRYTIGTWQIRSQTNAAQLAEIMTASMVGPGLREISEYEEHVRAVTPDAIMAAAQKYFDEAQLVEGIVRGQ